VNYGFDLIVVECLAKFAGVEQVSFDKLRSGDNSFAMPFGKIVVDDYMVAVAEQLLADDTTNVAGAPRN
jgi:hypothetical protein